jgi:osmotically-inducible protein OsmY
MYGEELRGEMGNVPERIAARHTAVRVSGVGARTDDLPVRVLQTPGTNDADIAQTAVRLLDLAVDVPPGSVRAEVHDHVITLSGQVPWDYQRNAAAHAVINIRGVIAVANTIRCQDGALDADTRVP